MDSAAAHGRVWPLLLVGIVTGGYATALAVVGQLSHMEAGAGMESRRGYAKPTMNGDHMRSLTMWVLYAVLLSVPASAQSPLPRPTGQYGTGTRIWHWTDPARVGAPGADSGRAREVMVQLWYPSSAASDFDRAPYATLDRDLARIQTWSLANAVFAPVAPRAPVIVLCPGRGTARHFYTAIAEELASHGFAVAAIDMPYIGRAVFPDGRSIPPSARYRPSPELMAGPYAQVDSFFAEAAAIGAADVAFVLQQLATVPDVALDLGRLGAFGHSLGGRICGAAVAADRRFRGYASMEGIPPREVRQSGLDAAVALFMSASVPSAALDNYREVIAARRNDAWIIRLEGFNHNSFTDLPLLAPQSYPSDIRPEAALAMARRLLVAFFAACLPTDSTVRPFAPQGAGIRTDYYPSPNRGRR